MHLIGREPLNDNIDTNYPEDNLRVYSVIATTAENEKRLQNETEQDSTLQKIKRNRRFLRPLRETPTDSEESTKAHECGRDVDKQDDCSYTSDINHSNKSVVTVPTPESSDINHSNKSVVKTQSGSDLAPDQSDLNASFSESISTRDLPTKTRSGRIVKPVSRLDL
ncbi:hypothetical protein QE152_g5743 [Popillia japonica]|uniref:Uncharacterized protein n=1 Tax=Popillia japonica TaxID=7064 RepID=A0AAW1MLJ8_POPJA